MPSAAAWGFARFLEGKNARHVPSIMASGSQMRLRISGGSSSAFLDGCIVAVAALAVGGADVDADVDAVARPSAAGGAAADVDVAANPNAVVSVGAEARATGCGAGLGAANPLWTFSMWLDNHARK